MKYILKMAFRNIRRNKRRTLLSAIAISIAVMAILVMRGYVGGMVDSTFDSLTKIDMGHIKIQNPEYHAREDMMPLEYMIDGFDGNGYEELVPLIERINGVKTVNPRIKFGVLLSFKGKTQSAMGMGVSPKKEAKIIDFHKIIVQGKYLDDDENAKSIIIGKALADKLGIRIDDKLTIVARTAYDSIKGMTFTVVGIFNYGISTMDSKLFYIPIDSAAKLLDMENGISELIVMLDKPENAKKIAQNIKEEFSKRSSQKTYTVLPWQDQEGFLMVLRTAMPIYNLAYLGLLILASTVIINNTMMVIFERTREIGTIGALGMNSRQIVLLFTTEAMIVSAIGSFIGMVLGGGIDLLLSIVGINFRALSGGNESIPVDIIYPRFGLLLLLGSFIFGVIVATIFAYIPARRSAKIEPAEALKSV